MRTVLFILMGVVLGVAGTLGVLAYTDDEASSTADAPSTAEINRAYESCMKAITEDKPFSFDDGPDRPGARHVQARSEGGSRVSKTRCRPDVFAA